jgi:cell shape-determining protein MreD
MQKTTLSTLAPHLITVLFVIMNVSSFNVAGLANVAPLFDLMAIFYFAVFKNIFAIWFIFLLGIWSDALSDNMLGATSLCYILLIKFFLLLNQKMLIRENFKQVCEQFVLFCFLFLLMKWAILSIIAGAFYSIVTPLVQLILSSVFYVLMHKFLDFLSSKLLDK